MKIRRSIRRRLALSAICLVLAVVAVISAVAYREVRRSAIAGATQRLTAVSRQLADMFAASAVQVLGQIGAVAADTALAGHLESQTAGAPTSVVAATKALHRLAGTPTSVGAVELWNSSGNRVLTTDDRMAPIPPADARSLMALAAGPRNAAIGWIGSVGGVMSYAVIAPVKSRRAGLTPAAENGAPAGYVVQRRMAGGTAQTANQLRALIGSGATLLVGNARGDLWTDLVTVAAAPPLDAAKIKGANGGVVEYERPAGHRVLAAINPIANTPWAIVLEFPRSLALQSSYDMLWRLAFITLGLLIIAAIGAWYVSGTLTRPIAKLVAAAEALSQGEAVPALAVDRRDELGTFAFAFNVMTERIGAARGTLESKVVELRDAEARYRMLFDANPQPMWVYDVENYAFLAVNAAAIERYGYSRDAFLAMTILDIRQADTTPVSLDAQTRDPAGGTQSGIGRHRIKNGAIIDVEVSSRALLFAGRSARLVLVNDLTERRRADEALRATRERLERVIGSSGAVLYELRFDQGDTVLEWMSENVTKILGYTLAEAHAPTWWSDGVHPADRSRLGTRPNQESYRDGSNEYRFRHRDGRYRWIREEQRVVTDRRAKTKTVIGAWIDLTEQRQLEAQLRQAQKMEAVGRLAGGVAHDFNNLLTVILAESQILLTDDKMAHAEQAESIGQIQKAADRAALLTRQLLTFSRQQLIEPTVLDLNVVVTDIDKMIRRLIGEDVEVRIALGRTPMVTLADRGQIEQVIVNLAVNARDAMPSGGILTIETGSIELDAAYAETHDDVVPGHYVLLAVSDTGSGMSDDVKAQIFEPFFTTKESGKGTGLGLATCYSIARQFGGHIEAYSEPGLGTTMKVYLPLSGAAAPTAVADSKVAHRGTETVLLVEDDAGVRRLTARMLESRGYTVVVAVDGEHALGVLEQFPGRVHLLLTDVVLPKMGGRALAEQVLISRPDIRVLYMSGYYDDVVLQHRLAEHGVVLLQKPFTADALVRKVHQALAAHPMSRMSTV
jgi:two-component system cell cycle sensor histidine kinase/response regulator CckA